METRMSDPMTYSERAYIDGMTRLEMFQFWNSLPDDDSWRTGETGEYFRKEFSRYYTRGTADQRLLAALMDQLQEAVVENEALRLETEHNND